MGALTNLATLGLNFALAQQAVRQESGDINRARDREIREIQARTEEERRRQQEALRRRLAVQRARAGAAGVGGGSAQAVLRGLTEEAAAAQEASDAEAAQRIADLRRRASSARERNLLELAGGATRSTLGLLGGGSGRRSLLDF